MTDQQHPITPNPEQIYLWQNDWKLSSYEPGITEIIYVATQAAQWGADQELNECCKWLPKLPPWSADDLRKYRRPKPPSLKDQALLLCDDYIDPEGIIRRALESLPS